MTALLDTNIDLLSVGIAVAAIMLLGCLVLFNNANSITNRTFFFFSILTAVWGVSNYLEYRFTTTEATLWAMRAHLFLSALHAYFFFQLAYVFPRTELRFPRWYLYGLIPIVVVTIVVVLTPLAFSGLATPVQAGQVTRATPGPGILLFMLVAFGALISGLGVLLRRIRQVTGEERQQTRILFIGMTVTALLILVFNVVLPNLFANLSFIPFAALFLLPFIAFTAYAIGVQHLFNIKVFSTALLVFLLSISSFAEIIFADTLSLVIFRSGVFVLILVFGISLIRGVLREVQQRERIQLLAQELQRSNEQLSEFMSLATHEIRNPATFIKGYTASALEGDLGKLPPLLKDGMEKLYIRANDIIHLGNQYLNKSKFELNQISYTFAPVDLNSLVQDLVHEFGPAAKQQGITISSSLGEGACVVEADAGKLKEVVANLIDNAIKYTPKGSVTITVTATPSSGIVEIVDTGVGVPTDVIPKLFKKFSRADAQKANILGTGLGLYISKVFVDAHHGSIGVQSAGVNKGSRFTVELPKTQPK